MEYPAPNPNIQDYQGATNVPMTTPQEEACRIVRQEKTSWENAVVFVTPQVAFYMPVLLRTMLKNYYGIFDQPTDAQTGQDKIWVPVTETLCETVVKNIDLGSKDINFHALNPEGIGYTQIVRAAVKQNLDRIYFGEKLKQALRNLAIWGTVVWSTDEVDRKLDVRDVNLLNFLIDPTAPSIAEADKVTERFPMTVSDFRTMARANKWINWQDVSGRRNVPRYDVWLNLQNYPSDTLFVEVYRLRGMVPRFVFTGISEDRYDLVSAEIIVSFDNGTWRFHDASLRKDNKNKGYEEAWYTRVPQRWLGRGVAEKSMPMQIYANFIVNVRKTRSMVSQLGLFKVKRGTGITTQSLQRLAVNGAVLVNNMEDIQQFEIQEASQASYQDEEVIWNWAQRVTQSQEITAGDQLPASTSATSSAIQNNQAMGYYGLVKENTGLWLERWLKNQALPIILGNMKIGDIIQYTGDPDALRAYDEHIVHGLMIREINKLTDAGKAVNPQQIMFELERAMARVQKFGAHRFVKMQELLDPLDYGSQVMITNEKMDEGVMTDRLIQALQIVQDPNQRNQIVQNLFDLMGIPYTQPLAGSLPPGAPQPGQPQQPPQQGGQAPQPQSLPAPMGSNPQSAVTAANTGI